MGVLAGCNQPTTDTRNEEENSVVSQASYTEETTTASVVPVSKKDKYRRGTTSRAELVKYAKLFYGVPYLYGSTDPNAGFDCSGFINYVYNHFGINVPRSSADFTNVGTQVTVADATPGDLILFTGTDSTNRTVGHIGIVVKNNAEGLEFIHSSSGKQYGVTINPLAGYYEGRFVKVIRLI
jgi:cell wall-associated NlpC family hydrolase